MKKIILAVAMVLGVSQAHAHGIPAWVCSMRFKGEAEGLKLIYGDYTFNGRGELFCVNPAGHKESYPVIVSMNSKKLSPQVSFGHMRLYGHAVEFSLFDMDPQDVLGTYYVAQGQAAILGGVGAITATKAHFPRFALHISLQCTRGLGVNIGINKMVIALDTEAPTPSPEVPVPAPSPIPAPEGK